MNRSAASAALLSAALLAVIGWAAVEYTPAPWWLVVAVGALVVAAILVSPGSDDAPTVDDVEREDWADE